MKTGQVEQIDVRQLNKAELIELLTATGDLQQQLFQRAREVRREHESDEVTLRGVIELSNYCQKNCDYCAMRATNPQLSRYRLSSQEILSIVEAMAKTSISVVFFQAGQDPACDSLLAEVIPQIKKRFNRHVLLCLGERPKDVYQQFAQAGADSYILKFETSDPNLYKAIAYTPLARRLQCIRDLQEIGFKVGTGNIVGLPNQTLDTLAEDIRLTLKINPDFASSSPFIPNQNTPLEALPDGNLNLTLNTMAIYRIAFKNCLIPAVSALEKIHPGGQLMGLNAGANVLTINFTPEGFRQQYAIYSQQRFVVKLEHAMQIIQQAGLQVRCVAPQSGSPLAAVCH